MRVDVTGLTFAYEKLNPILHGITFHVENGENLAILGASGCGKSTILKLISGLVPRGSSHFFQGQIFVGECDVINEREEYRLLKRDGKIGYLSQSPVLFDHMTVKDNIELPLRLINRPDTSNIDSLVDLVGLSDHLTKLPSELSGGMRTRAALARLFSTGPDILLLDEPFSSLDISRKSRLYKQFSALRGLSETTTIIVTHDIFEAILFSENILVVHLNGSAHMYNVRDWIPDQTYEAIVSRHYSCFTILSEMIK